MNQKEIYITETDMKKLQELIATARNSRKDEEKYLADLGKELDRSKIVKSQDIPSDVITMNSQVHLTDIVTGEESIYKLVFPSDSDADQGKVSILAPIGTALLGYRVGDTVEWKVPSGVTKLKIEKILYQPESSGDYHL